MRAMAFQIRNVPDEVRDALVARATQLGKSMQAFLLLSSAQADLFAAEVAGVTLRYASPEPWLLAAVWARHHNGRPYDAGYLALAEQYTHH
jgi:predicted nucleic acid-binding protein